MARPAPRSRTDGSDAELVCRWRRVDGSGRDAARYAVSDWRRSGGGCGCGCCCGCECECVGSK